MQSANNSAASKKNIGSYVDNSSLANTKKPNSDTRSKNDKSKSNANLEHSHKHSKNQNIRFPDAGHKKNQEEPHKKDVAKQKIKLENENRKLSDKKEFEKIQSYDSTEDTISYSQTSDTESHSNNGGSDLLKNKQEISNKINFLSKKQSETKNKGDREFENRGRELERLIKELEIINKNLGADNHNSNVFIESEKLETIDKTINENFSSEINFNER